MQNIELRHFLVKFYTNKDLLYLSLTGAFTPLFQPTFVFYSAFENNLSD
jgi:hypothetical protein